MLEYSLSDLTDPRACRVTLAGVITIEEGKALLNSIWENPRYCQAEAALWDISTCELPTFEELLRISHYIARHKAGRGPAVIAFISAAFETAVLARAFRGFQRIAGLDLNFLADDNSAEKWLAQRLDTH